MRLFISLTLLIGPLLAWGSLGEKAQDIKKKFKPIREVAIIATPNGLLPKRFSVFKNEELTIFFTSTLDKGGCLVIPSHRIFLSGGSGKVSSAQVTFTIPGRYEYYCPGEDGKMTGVITVFQRKAPEDGEGDKDERNRNPASVKENGMQNQWIPREG